MVRSWGANYLFRLVNIWSIESFMQILNDFEALNDSCVACQSLPLNVPAAYTCWSGYSPKQLTAEAEE